MPAAETVKLPQRKKKTEEEKEKEKDYLGMIIAMTGKKKKTS